MDQVLFKFINSLAGQSQVLDYLGVFFAEHLVWMMLALVLALWLYKNLRTKVLLALGSALAGRVIVELLKRGIERARPFEVMDVNQLLIKDQGFSFPSGHAVILFAIALAFYRTRWFWPLIVLATIGSIARVFVGVHYISDIIGSVVIAALVVWGLKALFKKNFTV
ncbi:MAG: phosphatase PAP2 family protein [Candidatus Doudnabacteria bacterium]|nr:phosphatase PAP2 family protein [Candidatus Doudnabacteria bacterium]